MTDKYLTLSRDDGVKAIVSLRAIAYIVPRDDDVGGCYVFFSGLEDDFLSVKDTLDQIQALL